MGGALADLFANVIRQLIKIDLGALILFHECVHVMKFFGHTFTSIGHSLHDFLKIMHEYEIIKTNFIDDEKT